MKIEDDAIANLERELIIQATVQELAPTDPIETMLISQMISVHNLATVGLTAAGIELVNIGDFQDRHPSLIAATKLLNTFTRQIEALVAYRGRTSNQKITVEQVNVESGANAIVGNVNTGGGHEK